MSKEEEKNNIRKIGRKEDEPRGEETWNGERSNKDKNM
jgi:hypothetical protein